MLYNNIAVALSGKDDCIPVLNEAVRIMKEQKSKLRIVHVNEPHAGETSMMMASEKLFSEKDFHKANSAGSLVLLFETIESSTTTVLILERTVSIINVICDPVSLKLSADSSNPISR